jgi:hypothetical protein
VLTAASTPEDVLENARNHFIEFNQYVRQDYRNIQIFGKEVITYEGGQHFVGNVFGIPYEYQQAMWDAQYHPGIYDLYRELHDTIAAWGCRLATNFSLASRQESVYGSWGVLNDIDLGPPYMETAPKYQALLDISCYSQNPGPLVQQIISIPQGWSGMSSRLQPVDPDMEIILSPLGTSLEIVYNFDGIYWPAGGISTLGDWDKNSGYIVKLKAPAVFIIEGYASQSDSLSVAAGWNIIPVLHQQNTNLEAAFAGHLDKIILVKEVAGNGVYWPEMGIFTLIALQPGKAYYLLSSDEFIVTVEAE